MPLKIKEYSLTLGAGIHIIDLINWLTGLRPISVYAVGNNKMTKGTSFKKNMIIEKPLCLNSNQLKKIYFLSKKNKDIKITSNLVLRTNSLFKDFKKRIRKQKIQFS